jgi:hypothetical protein
MVEEAAEPGPLRFTRVEVEEHMLMEMLEMTEGLRRGEGNVLFD